MNIPVIIIIKISLMLCHGEREHGTPLTILSNDTNLVVEGNKILDTYIAYGLFLRQNYVIQRLVKHKSLVFQIWKEFFNMETIKLCKH